MDPIHLDFETYSEFNVKKVGTSRVAEDPSTEVLCAAYAIGDGEVRTWTPGRPPPKKLFRHLEKGALVHAWNVEMEIPVWADVCVARMGWPRVPFKRWRDTSAVALSLALPPALENCGAALDLDVQKDRRGKHLVNKLCKPRKPTKKDPATRWTPATASRDFEDLYEYCRQDVRAERAIYDALPEKDLPPGELLIWRATVEMNLRGWAVDLESVKRMLDLLERHRARALKEIHVLTRGKLKTDGQRDKALEWLAARGVSLPDYTASTIEKALEERRLPRRARRFLELRRELAKTSTKKYVSIAARCCADGRVKNNILYHGAGTGRDAGRGIQIQNFPRARVAETEEGVEVALRALKQDDPVATVELVYGKVPLFASKMLRSMLVAAPGRQLYAADFASIENRIAVWYADCPYGIRIFEEGLDEYKMFARDFYVVSYEEVSEAQRQHSKHAVLGCVFGMGAKGLLAQAERFKAPTTMKVAKRTVDHYREIYSQVVETWYGLERAAKRAIKTPGKEHGYKRSTIAPRVGFQVRGRFLFMKLASGRELAYFAPRVELKATPWGERRWTVTHMGTNSKTHKWERMKIIPGRFFENVVQATARDAMMRGARVTARAGYNLVGRVHDELISETPLGFGSVEEYCDLMTTTPHWLRGIPVEASGWRGKRYRK